MRIDVGQVPERRPGRVAPLDGARHLFAGPVGGMAVLRQVPGPPAIFVVRHAVQVAAARIALVGQEQVVIVRPAEVGSPFLAEDDVVEADPVARRIYMQLADRIGLIAVVAEGLGQGRQIRHRCIGSGWNRRSPWVFGVRPGHHRPAGRDADRAFAVGARKVGAVGGQLIERRRFDRRGARQHPSAVPATGRRR